MIQIKTTFSCQLEYFNDGGSFLVNIIFYLATNKKFKYKFKIIQN